MRMRFTLAALAILMAAGSAGASCTPRSIGQSEASFAAALSARLQPLGVTEIGRVGHAGVMDHYLVMGADFSLFLKPDSGVMGEIGFVLSEPASSGETEKMLTGVAFTLARLSDKPEGEIKDQLYADLGRHTSGEWVEKFGSATAVFTRKNDGLVAKVGLLTCT